jgi:hypothetical protein
MSAATLN